MYIYIGFSEKSTLFSIPSYKQLYIQSWRQIKSDKGGLPEVVEVVPVLGHGAVHGVLPHLPCHVIARRKILQSLD
jgi:hypothetical protein